MGRRGLEKEIKIFSKTNTKKVGSKHSLAVKPKLGVWEWKIFSLQSQNRKPKSSQVGKETLTGYSDWSQEADNQLGKKSGVCNACMCLKVCLPSSETRVQAKQFPHESAHISFQYQQHVSKSLELILRKAAPLRNSFQLFKLKEELDCWNTSLITDKLLNFNSFWCWLIQWLVDICSIFKNKGYSWISLLCH